MIVKIISVKVFGQDMERDLGTQFDWVAANHYDTDQPHTHLVVRGKRDDGSDLVMPRRYITQGIRERAQDLVGVELGPVTEIAGRRRLAHMVAQERWTELDAAMTRRAQDSVLNLSVAATTDQAWRKQLYKQRLGKLVGLGLAQPLGKGRWRIVSNAEQTLRRLGERGDILKVLHRAMGKRADSPL